jgi:hypothetical protein
MIEELGRIGRKEYGDEIGHCVILGDTLDQYRNCGVGICGLFVSMPIERHVEPTENRIMLEVFRGPNLMDQSRK